MDLKNFEPEILPIFKNMKFSDPNFKKITYTRKHIDHLCYAIFLSSRLISGAHFTGGVHFWMVMLKKKFDDLESQKSKF